jgi:hypothetical protein
MYNSSDDDKGLDEDMPSTEIILCCHNNSHSQKFNKKDLEIFRYFTKAFGGERGVTTLDLDVGELTIDGLNLVLEILRNPDDVFFGKDAKEASEIALEAITEAYYAALNDEDMKTLVERSFKYVALLQCDKKLSSRKPLIDLLLEIKVLGPLIEKNLVAILNIVDGDCVNSLFKEMNKRNPGVAEDLLESAVELGNPNMVKKLLMYNDISVNGYNDDDGMDRIPLVDAITFRNNKYNKGTPKSKDYDMIIDLLLSHPEINLNRVDNGSYTPLSVAAALDEKDIVELLLKKGGLTKKTVSEAICKPDKNKDIINPHEESGCLIL